LGVFAQDNSWHFHCTIQYGESIMQLISLFLSLMQNPAFAQQAFIVPAEPQANVAPTPPLQFVNGGISQINNNERMAQATPAFSATPSFQPQVTYYQPPQQEQRVAPAPTTSAVPPPANLSHGGY
jgi:hypothetical protein